MARIYALLKPDGDLLIAHPRGGDWRVSQDRRGIDARGRNLTVFLNGLDVLGLNVSIPARNDKGIDGATLPWPILIRITPPNRAKSTSFQTPP